MASKSSPHDLPDVSGLSIAVLGGTGDQGRGLARRFAMAGHEVILGSRSAERAQAVAAELGEGLPGRGLD
ncbi:MAG UNVERIFIED_CONTAM: NAD(P)-binding domain-containing protein, partial [Thermobifida fusca]